MAKALQLLGVAGKTVLVSAEKHDGNLWKSARNIAGVSVSPVAELNALSILQPRAIVMTTAAIDAFREEVKRRQTEGRTGSARKQGGRAAARGRSASKTAPSAGEA
jgi:large subunit ribosomal protein L4